jgi:succinoglycan biosynthesis protein ExoM
MKVAICIVTYCRPVALRRLLEALAGQRFDVDSTTTPEVEVVVIDNADPGSAAAVCEEMRPLVPWRIRYEVEPERGISPARNRAVAIASADADLLAFVDDDEVPQPDWLSELLRVQREYSADIVAGPSVPEFEAPAPGWIVRGRFFERPRFATGTVVDQARTSNVLLSTRVFAEVTPAFDERFGLTGGEDTHFFARAVGAGFRIVWADEAVVRELVPAARARPPWLLRRAFRSGSATSIIAYELKPSTVTRVTRLVKGFGRVVQGILTLPAVVTGGRGALMRSGQRIFLGAGSVAGVLGITYEEYRRTTGR